MRFQPDPFRRLRTVRLFCYIRRAGGTNAFSQKGLGRDNKKVKQYPTVRSIKILTWLRGFRSFFFVCLAFFVLKSFLGIARQWSLEKFAILTLKPRAILGTAAPGFLGTRWLIPLCSRQRKLETAWGGNWAWRQRVIQWLIQEKSWIGKGIGE